MPGPPVKPWTIDRFHKNIRIEPNKGTPVEGHPNCWLWNGSIRKPQDGYGQLWDGTTKRQKPSHRHSFELHNGEIPLGMYVLHKCDVRLCCNPNHLFLGTQDDNRKDMLGKGREWHGKRGTTCDKAKLTDAHVIAIRRDPRLHKEICADYGVSRTLVSFIKSGKRWGWLHD